MKKDAKEQLSRMISLMNYGKVNESEKPYSTVEYTHEGADGKMYGLVREGAKYYIKISDKKSDNHYLKEDFDYVGGFSNKFRHEYSSFNNGLKQMEMFLRELNEECGRTANTIETWSKETNSYISTPMSDTMKAEIARQRQIMENASKIGKPMNEKADGHTMTDEAPKTGSTEEGKVFTDDVKQPTDTLGVNPNKDYTKKPGNTKVGDGTPFDEKPKKTDCNESEDKNTPFDVNVEKKGVDKGCTCESKEQEGDDKESCPKCGNKPCTCGDDDKEDKEDKDLTEDFKIGDDENPDGDIVDPSDDVDSANADDEMPFSQDDIDSYGDDEDAIGEPTDEPIDDTETDPQSEMIDLLRQIADKLDALAMDKGDESSEEELYGDDDTETEPIDGIDDTETDDEPFKESVNAKTVLETRLNDFGKHPRYQDEPIDGLKNSDEKKDGQYDMADDSIKNDKPYGTKIGDGTPFTVNPKILRDSIAEAVSNIIKKKLSKGK